MSRAFRILSLAEQELENALLWHESARQGLGADFLLCLDEAVARIVENPSAYPVADESVRSAKIHRFPYRIYYTVNPDMIEIIGVYHTSRRPIARQNRC